MNLILISIGFLAISWLLILGGLFFAIKSLDVHKIKKSKLFYRVTVFGEILNKISIYMLVISVVLWMLKLYKLY